MSLLTRLVAPVGEEEKLPVHQFMAALAELKRGAPGISVESIAAAFTLDASEQVELASIVANHFVDGIDSDLIHDALLLGERGIYTLQQVSDRLVNAPSATDLWPLITPRAFQVMAAGVRGDCVLFGCAVSAQGAPDMTLAVAKGAVLSNGVLRAVTTGNVALGRANSTLPRIDIVVADSTGAKQVRTGTAATKPVPPTLNTNDVARAFVFVPPNDGAIGAARLLDARALRPTGPINIAKLTTPITRSNSSAVETFLTLTLPDGLFTQGRMIRVRTGGTMLLNSGTPTVTLRVNFGGATLFQDVTGAATADTDRLAWSLDFVLVAQADNDQAFNAMFATSIMGAKTAPATGVGDVSTAAALVNAINGASAVDVTAADRDLAIAFQMSVANAANEIVMEHALAELF